MFEFYFLIFNEYYKQKVDGFGNKGFFRMDEQFRVCVITTDENLEEIKAAMKLPY